MRDRSWRAENILTGEQCPHHHHSYESAIRCANHTFGKSHSSAVHWATDDQTSKSKYKQKKRKGLRRFKRILKEMNREQML